MTLPLLSLPPHAVSIDKSDSKIILIVIFFFIVFTSANTEASAMPSFYRVLKAFVRKKVTIIVSLVTKTTRLLQRLSL